jgi:hypothetical protein
MKRHEVLYTVGVSVLIASLTAWAWLTYHRPEPDAQVVLSPEKIDSALHAASSSTMQVMVTDRRKKSMQVVDKISDIPNHSTCVGSYSDDQGLVMSCMRNKH